MYTGQPTALLDRVNITACPCNECNKHTKSKSSCYSFEHLPSLDVQKEMQFGISIYLITGL